MVTEWSPFYGLPKATLTPSGLLERDTADNEVELLRRSMIELRHEGPEPMYPCPKGVGKNWEKRTGNLKVVVTTHRLVLFDAKNEARFLHLSNI